MLGSSNISTTVVANELGVSTHSVSQLCASPNINQWSLYKPISVNKHTGLTEQDYLDNNFGFIIPHFNNFRDLRLSIDDPSKTDWRYDKPTGGSTSPFRLGDFRKYDHHATELFPLTMDGSAYLGDTLRISTITDLVWLTQWGEWSEFQGVQQQYLNVGFYVPGIGFYTLTDTDQGQTIGDIDSDKLHIWLDASQGFTVGRTYNVYLVLTTWDGRNGQNKWYWPADSDGGTWWYLPSSTPASFTVSEPPKPQDSITISLSGEGDFSEKTGYYSWTNITIDYSIRVPADWGWTDGKVTVVGKYPYAYSGTGTSTYEKTIFSFSENVTKGTNISKQIAGSSFNQLTSKEDSVGIEVEIRMQIGAQTYISQEIMTLWSR